MDTARVVLGTDSLLSVRLPKSPDNPETPQELLRDDYLTYAAIYEEVAEWCGGEVHENANARDECYYYIDIPTPEGYLFASDLYWILKDPDDKTFSVMTDAEYWASEGKRIHL